MCTTKTTPELKQKNKINVFVLKHRGKKCRSSCLIGILLKYIYIFLQIQTAGDEIAYKYIQIFEPICALVH